MTWHTHLQVLGLLVGFGSIIAAAWLWSMIAGLVVTGLVALFFAYVVREVQKDDEREARQKQKDKP